MMQGLKRKSPEGVGHKLGGRCAQQREKVVGQGSTRIFLKNRYQREDARNTEVSEPRRIEDLERRILELEAEKIQVGAHFNRSTLPSPRESSKGRDSSKRTMATDLSTPLKKFGRYKGTSNQSLSIDSCPVGSSSVTYSDPLSLGTWDFVKDVPPVELNDDLEPVGLYWEHLSQFAFERAKMIFDWHIEWRQQDSKMKSHLLRRLRRLYPGDWDSKYVFCQIGNNLKERRIRLRRRFEKCNNKSSVPVPVACWVLGTKLECNL